MKLAIIILAAGKASRMGSIKQLLKIKGKTLLGNTIETSKKIVHTNITCVLGANYEKIKANINAVNIDLIYNKNYESGLSSSIISGIKHLQKEEVVFDGVLILLADQPAIELNYYQEMIALFSSEQNKIIASNYGRKFGVPAIFPKIYMNNLLEIVGDKGAKEFLQQNKGNIKSPKSIVNLVDIDTPKDYEYFIKTL